MPRNPANKDHFAHVIRGDELHRQQRVLPKLTDPFTIQHLFVYPGDVTVGMYVAAFRIRSNYSGDTPETKFITDYRLTAQGGSVAGMIFFDSIEISTVDNPLPHQLPTSTDGGYYGDATWVIEIIAGTPINLEVWIEIEIHPGVTIALP